MANFSKLVWFVCNDWYSKFQCMSQYYFVLPHPVEYLTGEIQYSHRQLNYYNNGLRSASLKKRTLWF